MGYLLVTTWISAWITRQVCKLKLKISEEFSSNDHCSHGPHLSAFYCSLPTRAHTPGACVADKHICIKGSHLSITVHVGIDMLTGNSRKYLWFGFYLQFVILVVCYFGHFMVWMVPVKLQGPSQFPQNSTTLSASVISTTICSCIILSLHAYSMLYQITHCRTELDVKSVYHYILSLMYMSATATTTNTRNKMTKPSVNEVFHPNKWRFTCSIVIPSLSN